RLTPISNEASKGYTCLIKNIHTSPRLFPRRKTPSPVVTRSVATMPPKKSVSTGASSGGQASTGSTSKSFGNASSFQSAAAVAAANKSNKTGAASGTGGGGGSSRSKGRKSKETIDVDDEGEEAEGGEDEEEEEEEDEERRRIPPELLTRLLHEFFEREGTTRITRDANDAVARYMDVFVREAIARAAAERPEGRFLEVEDLEKIAPQLLLDL
ncbi:CENP-S associating centromere protein X-domain-containing protein, partial [Podospora appendiculata]